MNILYLAGWAALGAIGCGAAFGNEDEFRQRLADTCKSEIGCASAEREAKKRFDECEPNTIGKVRCEDAERDLHDARRGLEKYEKEAQSAKTDAEVSRQAAARAAYRQRTQDQEEVQRQQGFVDAWRKTSLADCTALWRVTCHTAPDGLSATAQTDCDAQCVSLTDRAVRMAFGRAGPVCEAAYVEGGGRKPASCAGFVPEGAEDKHDAARVACEAACAEEGKAALAARAREAEAARRITPAGGGASGGDDHIMCCDGTRSPTCTTVHRGCCSHHGGAC